MDKLCTLHDVFRNCTKDNSCQITLVTLLAIIWDRYVHWSVRKLKKFNTMIHIQLLKHNLNISPQNNGILNQLWTSKTGFNQSKTFISGDKCLFISKISNKYMLTCMWYIIVGQPYNSFFFSKFVVSEGPYYREKR